MSEIFAALTDITEWKLLGCALGIKLSVIDRINKDSSNSSFKESMLSLLTQWLNKNGSRSPTWRELAIAVSGPLVDNKRVAREIADNHPTPGTMPAT